MDANVPEKLYLFEGEPILSARSKKREDESIEYTRTDAFIEKACEWLRSNTLGYVDVNMDFEDMKLDKKFFKDFKKYMKGE